MLRGLVGESVRESGDFVYFVVQARQAANHSLAGRINPAA
jgi:hypothetical protein